MGQGNHPFKSFYLFRSELAKEVAAATKARGSRLGRYGPCAAYKASERKQKAIADAEGVHGVIEPMVRSSLSYGAMADALAVVGKLSSTGKPPAPPHIGWIFQRLGLLGKSLGSDQVCVVV